MGALQQVPVVAWCLLVTLPLVGLLVRHRQKTHGPPRVKAHVEKVNESLDQPSQQSGSPKMQILFFHGIPSDDFSDVQLTTWCLRDGFLWPQDWLPEKYPGIHVFFVKYDVVNENFHMNNIGENLVSDLLHANIGQESGCPVVLVGHCIGGLVIKELCWKAHEELHATEDLTNDRAKKLAAFLESVKGVFFYSAPHHGIREIGRASHLLRSSLFKFFETLSTDTSVLNSNFAKLSKIYSKWKSRGVGESLPVKSGVFRNILVVEEASAREGVDIFNTLSGDHFSVCKPEEKQSGGFYHLTNLLDDIAKEAIKSKEHKTAENLQYLPDSIVGIEILVQEVKDELKDVSMLGLTGMGGSGKSTLASAIFNDLCYQFEYTCFVRDVKFIRGRVDTLKKEVWECMHCNGKKVGGEPNWSQLRGKQLLLILDDISDERDIQALSEIAEGSSEESRFIATCREHDIFEYFYLVPLLERNNAKQLFKNFACQYNEILLPSLANLAEEIVEKCEGLPLTLEVLGKWLKKTKDEEVWKETLDALDKAESVKNFNERLWTKLRPSIDGLEEIEKQMFLDATSFFYGSPWTLREALAAWREAYGVSERLLWRTLEDRSLVYDVEEEMSIKVHEQLRSLGRKIASESDNGSTLEISKALRLLLSPNEFDKKTIHALRLKRGQMDEEGIQLLHSIAIEENLGPNIVVDGKFHMASLGLKKLENLRYLELNSDIVIDGGAEANWFPSSLVVLQYVGFKTLNLSHQRHLVVLKILDGKLESLPNCIGQLSTLRILTLSSSILKSIPEEIGELSKLEVIKILYCASLETLPERFGQLSNLKILRLQFCGNLHSLPKSFGNLSALEYVEFWNCGIETLPNSFGQLSALNRLQIGDCHNLESLPESFGLLPALVDLNVKYCLRLKSLPKTFGHLSTLSRLEFVDCPRLGSLPDSFGKLFSLTRLKVEKCSDLQSLPESLGQLAKVEYLEIIDCWELKRLPGSFAELVSLRHLIIERLWSLKSIPDDIQNLPSLHTLQLGLLPQLKELPAWLGEAGVKYLALSVKVFQVRHRLFSLTQDQTRILPSTLVERIHSRAMDKVETIDFQGALAELEVTSLEIPKLDGFLFQEKGILKRMMGDLQGALEDLNAALKCFSTVDDGRDHIYDCWKNRGYVKFLMGDIEGATNDGAMALKLQLVYCGPVLNSVTLGEKYVSYMNFRLAGWHQMEEQDKIMWSSHSEVLQKVKASDFQGAISSLDGINVLLLRYGRPRAFFLQERGILKRLAGDLGGALEDLTLSLEIWPHEDYDCYKHRGYVKFLLGDLNGARMDAEKCLTLKREDLEEGEEDYLGGTPVAFLDFNLK